MESVDRFLVETLPSLKPTGRPGPHDAGTDDAGTDRALRSLLAAQLESRHLDLAARWLQARGKGYYTIGSAGHESNAALGQLSRVTDPALLHYRSGGFFAARAAVAGLENPARAVLLGMTCAAADPITGGRHKVFGHPDLHIIPQTSTIASHLPRAVGLATSVGLAAQLGRQTPWPEDAIVLCSFGDASANHSTAVGALNAAAYLNHRRIPCPVLFVCEDNGLGISTPSPTGWPAAMLRNLPGLVSWSADGDRPAALLGVVEEALRVVRSTRRAGVLHLRTVRFMGHAGSDAEIAYRTQRQIEADYDRDPLLATARALVESGSLDGEQLLAAYEQTRERVMAEAERVLDEPRLGDRASVMAPLALPQSTPRIRTPSAVAPRERSGPAPRGDGRPQTLAQAINATLADLLADHDETLVFGEDVAVKGGVYGITRGLRKRFGGRRVFDTILDEQTVLGTALGAALAGFVPVPEIQYLAYLHNAEDQLRGEAASLAFFSGGRYRNGMVVRIAGLAYQRGFGGHFHNDNSVSVLRDIPGLVLAVPSHPADAPGMLRTCFALAQRGHVTVLLEPIARYHTRDLHRPGDELWTAPYTPPGLSSSQVDLGAVRVWGDDTSPVDVVLVTFGNGTYLSLQAARRLDSLGVRTLVADLRWLAPLPHEEILERCRAHPAVLVVDETRRSGGVGEGVVTGLVEGGYAGRIGRVASADSYVPLGPAAASVLLGEDEIVRASLGLLGRELVP